MIVASLGMMAFMFKTAASNPMMLMMPMMMVVSTVGMVAGGGRDGGQKKAEMNEDRKDYLRYLGQMRDRARDAADEQRLAREWVHPNPTTLWALTSSRRMWERRSDDPDFAHVRFACGDQRADTRLVPPQTGPVEELEPITSLALRRFVRAHSLVPDMPIATNLRAFAGIGLQGDRELCRSLVRAMLAQIATFHSPDDLLIVVASSGYTRKQWDWAKWLPHVQHPSKIDGIGEKRLITGSLERVEELLEELAERPPWQRGSAAPEGQRHIVVVLDDAEISREEEIIRSRGLAGVTLIDLSDTVGPAITVNRGMRLVVEQDRVGARSKVGLEWFGRPDFLSQAEAEALARRMAPHRAPGKEAEVEGTDAKPFKTPLNYVEQLGLAGDVMTFDLREATRPRPVQEMYKVAIGPNEYGDVVHLDIKEQAAPLHGMGPHGLCIGSTGSGKSEFLRTIVLGLLATHTSEMLNFVLVDFKGGATFYGFDDTPHVSAVITNLEENLTQVDRMRDALEGEVARRQNQLTKAQAKNVWDYEEKRQNDPRYADLDPLPALFIVIDEFSEMLTVKPEFADLFNQIGRVGRSLQMHLLLASQRLDEGKLRGLETHLSYKIGLKTFNAADSRAAIGIPDAADLPSEGGHGFLKHPNGMERFRAAYVSGPYKPKGRQAAMRAASPVTGDRHPRIFDTEDVPIREPEPQPEQLEAQPDEQPGVQVEQEEFRVVLQRLIEAGGSQAHQVWLPPLDAPPTLDALLQTPLSQTEDRGYTAAGYHGSGWLRMPVGLIDRPYQQMQETYEVDFSGPAGHCAVVGAAGTGKSNVFRTLVASLALTHTPQEVQFYCLDLGGGSMVALRDLPHVGAFAGRRDADTVRRTIAEMKGLLAAREVRFQEMGLENMADFRARKRRGEITNDPYGDVFLLIDGWFTFREDYETLEPEVMNLAANGLSYGIHVFISANRWAEMKPALQELLQTRFELRLGDPSETMFDRKAAQNVPQGHPGRGLHPSGLHYMTAIPRVDSENLSGREGWKAYSEDLGDGVADLVNRIKSSWRGQPAPQVRLLPELLPYEQLPTPDRQPKPQLIPIGVNEDGLNPVYLDFRAEPHFYAFAEREAGKTALVRTIIQGITTRYTPQEAVILLADFRHSLLGFLNSNHLLEYAVSADQLQSHIRDVAGMMQQRLPGPNVTQEQLRTRSWWRGPELFVIVDDYDLVAQQGNPLEPLERFLPQAGDIGLHLVLVRNAGGASRAMFSGMFAKMRELSQPGLLMSAPKDEGQIIGNLKARELPPGRGTLVSRLQRGPQLIQVGWVRPDANG